MKKDSKSVYFMNLQGVNDIAYGILKSNEKEVQVGLASHSVTFIPEKIIKDDDTEFRIKLIPEQGGGEVSFRFIDKKVYDEMKKIGFLRNSPKIKLEDEVQEYFWTYKSY